MKDKIFVHIGHHLGLMQASTLPTSAPGEEEYIRKGAILEWAKEIAENASWVSIDAVVNIIESL